MGLPPDLDRLGDVLAHATARSCARAQARRERQRRLAGGIAAGVFVFAAMTPSPLDRADQPDFLRFAITSSAQAAVACDQPRGQRFGVSETCADEAPPAPQALRAD